MPPLEKILLQQPPSTKFLFPLIKGLSPATPLPTQITIFLLELHKGFIFSCSHCSCTIFILNLQYLYIKVMLSLILINVKYLQNLVFSSEKSSNVQNHSLSDSHHSIKKFPLQNLLSPIFIFRLYPMYFNQPHCSMHIKERCITSYM